MTSRWSDLDRPPLDERRLRADLARDPDNPWDLRVLAETGSTNADAAAAARAGAPEGVVVVAEAQTAGRGRLDRQWVSPDRAGLTFSLLLRPPAPLARYALLPLLVASAAARAVEAATGVPVSLKWPNDLLVGERKLAGLLAESVVGARPAGAAPACVVGVGLNVSTRPDELPRADATSLWIETREPVDRHPLLLAILRAVGEDYARWGADPGAALPAYRGRCATLGRGVRVELPGAAESLTGRAESVDDDGRLVVRPASDEVVAVSAGDVVHVRPADRPD